MRHFITGIAKAFAIPGDSEVEAQTLGGIEHRPAIAPDVGLGERIFRLPGEIQLPSGGHERPALDPEDGAGEGVPVPEVLPKSERVPLRQVAEHARRRGPGDLVRREGCVDELVRDLDADVQAPGNRCLIALRLNGSPSILLPLGEPGEGGVRVLLAGAKRDLLLRRPVGVREPLEDDATVGAVIDHLGDAQLRLRNLDGAGISQEFELQPPGFQLPDVPLDSGHGIRCPAPGPDEPSDGRRYRPRIGTGLRRPDRRNRSLLNRPVHGAEGLGDCVPDAGRFLDLLDEALKGAEGQARRLGRPLDVRQTFGRHPLPNDLGEASPEFVGCRRPTGNLDSVDSDLTPGTELCKPGVNRPLHRRLDDFLLYLRRLLGEPLVEVRIRCSGVGTEQGSDVVRRDARDLVPRDFDERRCPKLGIELSLRLRVRRSGIRNPEYPIPQPGECRVRARLGEGDDEPAKQLIVLQQELRRRPVFDAARQTHDATEGGEDLAHGDLCLRPVGAETFEALP